MNRFITSLYECERLLDSGRLQKVYGDRWYTLRRNGVTRPSKTTQGLVEIPVKADSSSVAFHLYFEGSKLYGYDYYLREAP
jgi:hypothetical protein